MPKHARQSTEYTFMQNWAWSWQCCKSWAKCRHLSPKCCSYICVNLLSRLRKNKAITIQLMKYFPSLFHSSPVSHLLLIKHYNLYKVRACSTTFFQLSLFCATFFQLSTFMFFISSKTSSFQGVLDLPIGLLDMGFHLLILCTILSSAMRSTCPNQFSLCFLINPIIFCPFSISMISWLVLTIQ